VKIDQEGWIFFVDRSIDLIKHKGYRISVSRVEGVLQEHYAVMACFTQVQSRQAFETGVKRRRKKKNGNIVNPNYKTKGEVCQA